MRNACKKKPASAPTTTPPTATMTATGEELRQEQFPCEDSNHLERDSSSENRSPTSLPAMRQLLPIKALSLDLVVDNAKSHAPGYEGDLNLSLSDLSLDIHLERAPDGSLFVTDKSTTVSPNRFDRWASSSDSLLCFAQAGLARRVLQPPRPPIDVLLHLKIPRQRVPMHHDQ